MKTMLFGLLGFLLLPVLAVIVLVYMIGTVIEQVIETRRL